MLAQRNVILVAPGPRLELRRRRHTRARNRALQHDPAGEAVEANQVHRALVPMQGEAQVEVVGGGARLVTGAIARRAHLGGEGGGVDLHGTPRRTTSFRSSPGVTALCSTTSLPASVQRLAQASAASSPAASWSTATTRRQTPGRTGRAARLPALSRLHTALGP